MCHCGDSISTTGLRHRENSWLVDSAHQSIAMVTGIEVAGIALAVFPIVVNGLSHFAEGVETIKSWRRYRRELTGYARTLESQRIWYLDTIEELLDGIVHSEEELAALSHDPGGDAWQRPEYEAKLKRRLDHSYNPYMANMSKTCWRLSKAFRTNWDFPCRTR